MSGRATRITDLDGEEMLCPINMDKLQRYNIWKEKERKPANLKTWKGGLDKN